MIVILGVVMRLEQNPFQWQSGIEERKKIRLAFANRAISARDHKSNQMCFGFECIDEEHRVACLVGIKSDRSDYVKYLFQIVNRQWSSYGNVTFVSMFRMFFFCLLDDIRPLMTLKSECIDDGILT